jgi:hypothetical protein
LDGASAAAEAFLMGLFWFSGEFFRFSGVFFVLVANFLIWWRFFRFSGVLSDLVAF